MIKAFGKFIGMFRSSRHLVLLFWEHNSLKSSEKEQHSSRIGPAEAGFFYVPKRNRNSILNITVNDILGQAKYEKHLQTFVYSSRSI